MRSVVVRLALVGVLGTGVAEAAPVVGSPFFLATAGSGSPDLSIAGNSSGFLLSWGENGTIYAQRFAPSGSLVGRPWELDGASSTASLTHTTRTPSGVRVTAADTNFAALWRVYYGALVCCTNSFQWSDDTGAVISPNGTSVPAFGSSSSSPTSTSSLWLASAGDGWVLADESVNVTPPTSGTASLSVSNIQSNGSATGSSSLFQGAISLTSVPSISGIASNGQTALAAWTDASGLRFSLVETDGSVIAVTGSALPNAVDDLHLASDGSGYLVVWKPSGSNALLGVRLSGTGTVLDTSAFDVIGAGGAAPAGPALDVEAAGSTYLVLYQAVSADGGTATRGARVTRDGSVLDPGGFDVSPGRADAARAGADTWLVASWDPVDSGNVIEGRFIGATSVPPAPPNVPPSPPPDAGATAVDGGTDLPVPDPAGPAPQDGGVLLPPPGAGGARSDAGSPPGVVAKGPSSGGSKSDASDASDGASTARPHSGGGSSCSIGRAPSSPIPAFVIAAVGALAGMRGRRSRKARR
jgi:hypothetical protein